MLIKNIALGSVLAFVSASCATGLDNRGAPVNRPTDATSAGPSGDARSLPSFPNNDVAIIAVDDALKDLRREGVILPVDTIEPPPPPPQQPVVLDVDALMLNGASGAVWAWTDSAPRQNTVTLSTAGDHGHSQYCPQSPCHETFGGPPNGVVIIAEPGQRASVTLNWARPVSAVSFAFRYLSTNAQADERLNTFRVNNSPQIPALVDALGTELVNGTVKNREQNYPDGRGKLVFSGQMTSLSFTLESFGNGNGLGTHIITIQYTTI